MNPTMLFLGVTEHGKSCDISVRNKIKRLKKAIRRFVQASHPLEWNVQSMVSKQGVLEVTPTITINLKNNHKEDLGRI
jgi:hypothetical protein